MPNINAIRPVIHEKNLLGRVLALSVEGRWFESPVGSSQRLKNCHLLLLWLAFTIKGLEQVWLAVSV